MASSHRLRLSLIFLSLSYSYLAFSTAIKNDVHDLLPKYGFPRGLIPANVKSYNLDEETGSFDIQLEAPCYVQFDRLVWYDKVIKGRLTYGAVHDVSGIQAKKLFLWVTVTGIQIDKEESDMIQFYVGSLSQKLPVKEFFDVPTCKGRSSLRTNLASVSLSEGRVLNMDDFV